jgi:nucleoside-diphosphate-sugar epimerase
LKVFITGGSGFIGSATVRESLRAGHEVAVAVRPGNAAWRLAALQSEYRRFEVDLRDTAAVAAAMTDFRPDAVLHLAWSGVANTERFATTQITDNIEAACSIVDSAAKVGAAFIGIGSQGEYGAGSAMREDALPGPTSLYGAAKVAALYLTRQLAAQKAIRHAWLRLFSSFGPFDNDCWLIPTLIGELLKGRRPKTTLGTQKWDWLYVDDVARAILAVASTPTAEGVFNLGSGKAVVVRDVVERIRDLTAPGMDLVFGEIPFRPDQVMHVQADISRLMEATGWQPEIPIEEGLARTVDWYRNRAA